MTVLDDNRNKLWQSITDSHDLIRLVNSIMQQTTLPQNLDVTQRNFIVEWLFVRTHSAWENFLESCFLNYMLGVSTDSGFAPIRFVNPRDEQHAVDIIRGSGRYIRWSDPSIVKMHAGLYFASGEPFVDALNLKSKKLQDINTIRNAVVHNTTESMQKFMTLVRLELPLVPALISPGKFLTMIKPGTRATTFFNSYCKIYVALSKRIVPL